MLTFREGITLAVLTVKPTDPAPWIFGFTSERAASWNAWLRRGLMIAALAIAGITAFAEWEERINLAPGIWVLEQSCGEGPVTLQWAKMG